MADLIPNCMPDENNETVPVALLVIVLVRISSISTNHTPPTCSDASSLLPHTRTDKTKKSKSSPS